MDRLIKIFYKTKNWLDFGVFLALMPILTIHLVIVGFNNSAIRDYGGEAPSTIVIAIIDIIILILIPLAIREIIKIINVMLNESAKNYIQGENFSTIKEQLSTDIKQLNELNTHIERLKNINFPIISTGNSNSKLYIHKCSQSVLSGARDNPYKYVCKYFDIEINEASIELFGDMLNNEVAIEQGSNIINDMYESIIEKLKNKVPSVIYEYHKDELIQELGVDTSSLNHIHYTYCIFRYTSSAGRVFQEVTIKFDSYTLREFIEYLKDEFEHRNSVRYQRQLMTNQLREKIKKRDNYTCCRCGACLKDEPHLLLEIDHIIPISKGGTTVESNLQTLCWKCNRNKGTK